MKYTYDNKYLMIDKDFLMEYVIMMSIFKPEFDKDLFDILTKILSIVHKYQVRKNIIVSSFYISTNDKLSDYLYKEYYEFINEFSYNIESLYKIKDKNIENSLWTIPFKKRRKKEYNRRNYFLELKNFNLIENEFSYNKERRYPLTSNINPSIKSLKLKYGLDADIFS